MNTAENTGNGKNLAFFKEFLSATGVAYPELAERIGLSTNALFYWFRSDDIRLSLMMNVAEALGYHLYISLSDDPIDMINIEQQVSRDGLTVRVKRLNFLTVAMREQGVTKIELAARIGRTRDTVTYWYIKDDITIKNLIRCAVALRRNLNFKFVHSCDSVSVGRDDIAIHSSIESNECWVVKTEQ